jgi:hypothetical protein
MGRSLGQSQLSLTALAQLADFKSLSCQKLGQSHSFQAKLGQDITNAAFFAIQTVKPIKQF